MKKRKRQSISEGQGIWEHFTVRDGLPDMKIECIFEDSQGALWVGTHDRGVVCYEGHEFKSYTRRDGLAGDGVFSILEDRSGDLWFGTNQGLTRYNGREFETLDPGERYSFLWGSCMDQEGVLWFGMERRPGCPPAMGRWDGQKLEVVDLAETAEPQGQSIHQIVADPRGGLWCGGDGLYYYDGTVFHRVEEPADLLGQILCLLAHADGTLWICTENESGLYIYRAVMSGLKIAL